MQHIDREGHVQALAQPTRHARLSVQLKTARFMPHS